MTVEGLALADMMKHSGELTLLWCGLELALIAVMFGVLEQGGAGQTIAVLPEFVWELLLGLYLTAKGFRPSAAASQPASPATQSASALLPASTNA